MNTFLFSLFLLITLGLSIFSASGTAGSAWNTADNTQYTVNLSENLALSSGFAQKTGNNYSIMLSEQLELLNTDRYQNMVTASKHISDTKAIMERILPNTRLRLTDTDSHIGSDNTGISDFIETITDTFYQGGANTPSLPAIPMAITTADTGSSLQTLQLMDTSRNGLEPFFDDSGTSWSEPIQHIKNQYASKIFLVNSIEEFSSNLSEINPPKLDSTVIILVVTFPFAIYVLLIAEGIVRPPNQPKIPQYASFYFVLVCYVFGTFSTPFSIGQSYWGTAYGEMDNSTDNSTNSTDITNPEYISANLTNEEESTVSPLQNATLTETDNVADSDGPKHYTVFIEEALSIGDGPSNEAQNLNESTTQQAAIPSENSTDVQISEFISFFDYVTSDQQAAIPSENSIYIQISEFISFFDYSASDQQAAIPSENSTDVQISEYISFFDYSTSDNSIVSDVTINLNEQIEFSDGTDGLSSITTVEISEYVTFGSDIETVLYTPLRETVEIQEDLLIGAQIAINGVAKITVSEHVEFSEKITIKAPTIRILEFINFSASLQNQLALLPLEDIPYLGLLSQNSTLILNGTTNVVSDQDIANTTSTLTISAWIKPEFNTGSPQYTIVSKEYSFDLHLTNILEPARTIGFSVFDGAQWKTVSGSTVLDERWHHVAASIDGSNIALYVDGLLEGELELENGIIIQESQITSDDSDIVIGAYVNTVNILKTSNMFAGMITSVDVYSRALPAEQVYQKYQTGMQEFYKTVSLYETIQVSEYVHYESPFYVMLDETLELYEFTSENVDEYTFPAVHVMLDETLELYEFTSENATNTLTVSAWIKPEFNTGSPQYTIVSKEYSFDLHLTNILEPARTTGFSVFDGAQWKTVFGSTVLDERWHHVAASIDGSNIALYVDGLLEGELELENGIAFDNSELVFQDSQILPDDSDIVIGAYVNTVNAPKTLNKFAGMITSVDVYSRTLTAEQIYQKYQTDMQEFYKTVSLYETIQVNEYVHYEVTEFNPSHVQLEEHLAFYDEVAAFNPSHVQLEEYLAFYDEVTMSIPYRVQLEEHLAFYDEVAAFNPSHVQLEEHLAFYDEVIMSDPFDIHLEESLQFDDHTIALNPFVPSVNPEIKMVKSGFMITENPKFELEYYSEYDAAKIDRKEIENATSIANQVQEDLALTPIELLSRPGTNEIITALQVIQTSLTISELEDQVEQIPEDVKPEDIKQLQEKVEEVTESIEDTAKSLGETHLEDKAEEIKKSAEMIREAADITQDANQTGTWQTTDENITTRIIAPDGSIFADEAFFEKEREGKFGVEVLPDAVAKPGIYTVQSTITVDQTEYTINEEFAWGLVSLNTKKSTYYPGETAEFEIVVLDSVGSPVCDASLVMSINGTTLSSGAGITPNSECGIYDSAYDTGMEGTYHVEISAIADGIQTGFETTFDVAEFVEFDIIRTAQSKIDPVNNPNKFEVVIDVTSHANATDVQIVESVPSVFDIVSDGIVTETADGKNITWDRTLQNQTAQIKYTYSVPLIFPELFPLGEAVISHGDQTFTEARPWFVANDPDIGSGWKKKVLSTNSTMVSGSSDLTNFPVLITLTLDPDLSQSSVGNNGSGIRFTSDGTELLSFEIERYDGTSAYGNVTAWVKIPELSATSSDYIYIHYGNPSADSSSTWADVWTEFVAVNHLYKDTNSDNADKELTGSKGDNTDTWNAVGMNPSHADSGQSARTLDTENGAKIGHALEFDGSALNKNDRICLDEQDSSGGLFSCQNTDTSTHFDAIPANRSTSLWYKADNASECGNCGDFKVLLDAGSQNHGQVIYINNGILYAGNIFQSNAENHDWVTTATDSDTWHQLVFVKDGTDQIILYHDGEVADTEIGVRTSQSNNNQKALGDVWGKSRMHTGTNNSHRLGNSAHPFDGMMDEFRVANSVLSADWIKTSYNTENTGTWDPRLNENVNHFTCEGICLSESISFTDSASSTDAFIGTLREVSETIGFTDSVIGMESGIALSNKKVLSTNPSLISGSGDSLTGLAVVVSLTFDPKLTTTSVGEDGEGIRFTSDGVAPLDFEIERYEGNSNHGNVTAWVEIPTLSATATQYFYIHYGQTTAQAFDAAAAVWDGQTSGGKTYTAVNHLHNTPTSASNDKEMIGSLPGGNDDFGTGKSDMGSGNVVDGKISKALKLNEGSADRQFVCLETEDTSNFHTCNGDSDIFSGSDSGTFWDIDEAGATRSTSIWYKAVTTDNGGFQVIFEEGASNGQSIYLYDDKIYGVTSKSSVVAFGEAATTANEWHHVVLVWVDDDDSYLYHDGALVDTFTGKDHQKHSNAGALGYSESQASSHTSGNLNEGHAFDGIIDEFRVTNTKLSTGFIANTYQIEKDPTNFVRDGIHLSETLSLTDITTRVKEIKEQSILETLELADSLSKEAGIPMTETLSLTDITTRVEEAKEQSILETLSLTDTISKSADKLLSETLSLTDITTRVEEAKEQSILETLSLTDTISKAAGIPMSETLSLTDITTRVEEAKEQSILETLSLTDTISKSADKLLSETLSLTDITTRVENAKEQSILETLSLTDTISKAAGIPMSETLSLTDITTGVENAKEQSILETLSLTDTISKAANIPLSETLSLTDITTGVENAKEQSILETLSLTDTISKAADIPMSETLSLTDITTGVENAKEQSILETLSLTDSISKSADKLLSETLSLTDITTGVENAKEQSILETLALTDTISKAAGIPMSETLSLTDITTGVENAKEQSILETLALTDTISKAAGIPMSETLSLTDITTGVENAKEQSILETLALTDTISKAAGIPMSETLSLTDITTGVKVIREQLISETLSLTDTISKEAGIPMSETLSLTDITTGVKVIREQLISETLSLTDTISKAADIPMSETLSLTDITTGVKVIREQLISETLSLTDTISKAADIPMSETLSLTDITTGVKVIREQLISETLSLTDTISKAANIPLSETLSLTDITTGVKETNTVELLETLSLTDTISKEAGIPMSETLSLTDITTGVKVIREQLISETLSLTDTISKAADIPMSETLSLTDITTGVKVIREQLISETLSLTDTISKAADIPMSETLSLTDITTGVKVIREQLISETLSLTDTISKAANIPLSETLSLTDITTGVKETNTVELLETLSLTDTISKEAGIPMSETLSLTDITTGVKEIREVEFIETLALTDIITKSTDISLSESISLTDRHPSAPTNIVAKDHETDDANGFDMIENANAVKVFTIGASTYAIVTSPSDVGDDGVQIIDISDPDNIVAKDTAVDTAQAHIQLADAMGVDTFTIGASTYAIVTAFFDDGVQVIDISDPTDIRTTDSGHDDSDNPAYTELNAPNDVDIFTIGAKTYAIVASVADSGVQVIDVSNPNNIIANGEMNDTGSLELGGANSVDTFTLTGTYAGTYAIITGGSDDGIQIIDISNPSPTQNNLVAKDSETDNANGFTVLDGPSGVDTFTVASNSTATYAIVLTSGPEDGIQMIDVSNPTAIVAIDAETDGNNDFNIMNDPGDVDVFTLGTSTYAIVTSIADDGVQIIDVSNPANIVVVDSLVDSGSLELDNAKGVDTFVIDGNTYAIVTADGDEDGVQIIELSTETGFSAVKDTRTISLSETLSLTDTISKAAGIPMSETLSLTDITTGVKETNTVELLETLSLTDTISKAANIPISDTLSLTDIATGVENAKEQSILETLSLTDTISKAADISMSETLSLTDITTGVKDTRTVSLSETLSLTDTISKAADIPMSETLSLTDITTGVKVIREQLISETLSLTDTISKAADIPMSETLSLTDITTGVKEIRVVSLSETLSLTDTISKAADIPLSETISFTDSVSRAGANSVSLTETLSLTYSLSRIVESTRSLSETLSLTDIISKEAGIPMSETLSLTDSISSTIEILLSETLSLTDTISKSADISLSETLSLTDTVSIDGTTSVSISETLSLTDIISKAADIPMLETLSLTDITTRVKEIRVVSLSETLSLTDTISKAADIPLSETISFTDSVSRAGASSVSLTETLSLTDSLSRIVESTRSLSETLSLTYVATIDGTTNIELSETLSLTDTISKAAGIPMSETLSLTDSISSAVEVILSETLSVNDNVSGAKEGDISLTETLSLVDLVLVQSAPFAPTLTAVSVGNQIILSWNQPFNGNLPITDYKIQHSNNNGASWNTINDGVNTGLAFTVLPNYDGCPSNPCINLGVEAKFRMLAVNSMGNGDSSVPVDVTPAASTSTVYDVTILPQTGEQIQALYVKWEVKAASLPDICDYLIEYATNAAGPWTLYDDGKSMNQSVAIYGISTFTSTFVKVTPVLCSTGCPGEVSEVAWTMPVQMSPQKIDVFYVAPRETGVLLEWREPSNGGAEITSYEIRMRTSALDGIPAVPSCLTCDPPRAAIPAQPAQSAGDWLLFSGTPTETTRGGLEVWQEIEVTGLTNGIMYDFQVRAINSVGPTDDFDDDPGQRWSDGRRVQTQEVVANHQVSDIFWGNDGVDNDHDGQVDEQDEQKNGPPPLDEDHDFGAEGTQYADDTMFDGKKDFGAGQTFGDNTEFVEGQEFDNDVNFSGQDIKFNGAKFENAETFGVGAHFAGTQDFTGANTFSANTKFDGTQNFGSDTQTFGAGTEFKGTANFASGQNFADDTKFAVGQAFDSNENYNFGGTGIDFGASTNFGKARTFGSTADFTAGTQTFSGINTFATGTKFASGQAFDGAQNFGASQEFAANMEFGSGQSFALDFDFNKESMKFGSSTTFCSGETLGKDADFTAGTNTFGGASTFKNGTKFYTGQDFSSYTHTFTDHQTFGADTGFKSGQSFGGDVAFSGLFDFNDMKGKVLVFSKDVDFFMPPSGEPLGIPAGTTFGDDFDRDSMFVDADGDGVNDKRHMFEAGVIFAANTMFPPRTEFVDGFSFDDMDGKTFTFEEGNFMGGAPHFPSGQTIKPGIMWGGAPTFDSGVTLEAGLALPDNSVFSVGLEMPAGAAPAYGMLLTSITCADADCIPDPSAYLAPGELLPPGVDPEPVVNYITSSNSTFSNPGLGFEMEFDSVTKDGKVNVDLKDPATVPGTTVGATAGQRSMDLSGNIFQNVGSIIDVSVDSATTSGLMTVTLPYDSGVLDGASEDELVLLHYTGGKWVTVSNIIIDTINNTVTGTVTSLSPFTVGTQTGSTVSGGPQSYGPYPQGGGGGGGYSDSPRYEAYPLQIHSVSYDTCDTNMARIVVGPEYDKMDIVIKTSTGFVTAKMVGVDPVSNHVIFEAPLYTDSGTLQVSASVFMDPLFLRANPFVTTLMACAPEPVPEQEQPEREEFQKPDAFITQIQCSVGTTLVDGECIPVQIGVILLLVILFVGLALALPIWMILRRRAELLEQVEITRLPVEEYVPEVLRRPPEIEIPEPEIETPEPEIEIEDIVQLINSLQEQTIIQDHIHRMQSQLLELTQEERTVQRNLTTILEQVYQEVRPKVLPKIPPQLPLQLLALPAPKRKYTKKKRTLTDEHKAKIAAAKRGHSLTLKTKEKISIVKKGRKMSDEHKAKIAAAKRGRKMSDEHKAKIAAAHAGIKHSPQTKQKMSESKKQNKLERKKKKSDLDELTRRYDILGQGENDETT